MKITIKEIVKLGKYGLFNTHRTKQVLEVENDEGKVKLIESFITTPLASWQTIPNG